jgi:two-component system sensor kinase FixL
MYEHYQLRALIDTAVDGIISISAAGEVRLYNKASERIFGYAAEEVLGKNVHMLMPPGTASAHDGYIANYLATGDAQIIGIGRQTEGRRADGTIFPMHLSVGEFEDQGEAHFVGIIRDLSDEMTERRRTQTLQEQLELIGRHSAVSEMGAALAHELNQPLTAIDLFLAAAAQQLTREPEKARQTFERVRAEASRAGNIVRRIREMVERTDGERSSFRMNEVIDNAVELCRLVDRGRAVIEIRAPSDALVFGDPTQIRMILVNLVKNALDALTGQSERLVLIRTRLGDAVTVEVLDNGPGVSEEMSRSLFDPFSSSKENGLGIGLSICRTIAEGHGGTLRYVPPADQDEGLGGAMFQLTLPLSEDEDE